MWDNIYKIKVKIMNKENKHKCNVNANKPDDGRSPYGTWKCTFCGLIFKTRSKLEQHKRELQHTFKGTSWNKGLTKESDQRIANGINTLLNNFESGKLKPSKLGKKLSKESREKISKARSKILDAVAAGFKNVGWYKVKNINNVEYTVRGHWEENVALKLNEYNILWEKNKWIEYFDGEIIRHYNPDFYIPDKNLYIEVKGYFSDKDKLKMKFVLEQNDVKIYFIGSDKYFNFITEKINFDDNLLLDIEILK